VEIEYVSAPLELVLAEVQAPGGGGGGGGGEGDEGAGVDEFRKIMQHFGSVEELLGTAPAEPAPGEPGADGDGGGGAAAPPADAAAGAAAAAAGASSDEEGGDADGDGLSKTKRKAAARMKIAELKQQCERPDVVEVWDTTAADPRLLVYLKAYRNTVPVPRHWSQKRAYLAGKRGLEKPPFALPAFIAATGISDMRQAYLEKAETQKLKSKGRERMQPKMGKLDIDYQVLHDAFFRHQTRPPLTAHGELYYEGREFEASTKHARPGVLSAELQEALGMEPGAPPPWLISQQRYGPPPSYPSLRIAGLSAPIPPGAAFGYHPGGWGKPPVDEYGTPVYGNVFGAPGGGGDDEEEARPEAVVLWGEVDEESEEEEESEAEEEEEEEEADSEEEGAGIASVASGLASSLPSGIETPAEVQLRKAAEAHAAAAPEAPKALYQVLEQQAAAVGAAGIMGSDHTYVVPGAEGAGSGGGGKKMSIAAAKRLEALRREVPSDLDVSIDPGDLEGLDDGALKELYEARVREQRAAAGREDFSDLVAEKAAAQKRKGGDKGGGKDAKKFKF
jgi:splicing factor 3B subunit 2